MSVHLLPGDCRAVLATLPAESVHCVVTSPPYWGLRAFGAAAIGHEPTTLWLNLGDSYASTVKWAERCRHESNRQR